MIIKTPKIIGILNITPDSFSDGGKFSCVDSAVKKAIQLIEEGAGIIDIGAESTRPGAKLITSEEEQIRLQDILPEIIKLGADISLDTYHPETAAMAIKAGVHWINDVSGLNNSRMIDAIKDSHVKIVFMHNLGIPADKNIIMPKGCDLIAEISDWAKYKIMLLDKCGISIERLIFDPGIGFGKDAEQSMHLINNAEKFRSIGTALLYGHSRKSFLNLITNKPFNQRDPETIEASILLAKKGVDYLRVHNVKGHCEAFSDLSVIAAQ